mmetsp:Transcript_38132/g.108865  ORF Transcript_38132/g.108865 Transcript_38132/m.108865 type:complete len:143 (-) Transcript_38132:94-522(-)|eukprot:CAMPEP_0184671826 /NCGR_PEP_ID=MMETSP0308-20130426/85732_1 /TAXON_ID=38269 /ORGANISM="Gloeochaete witrockiana, Strain SAG 46.84" /LENGTH=142 /DNA_ID=CAMNT_0027119027 /DNA_START=2560 /DNA_END=2988 /DNA_ORIENTATION=+
MSASLVWQIIRNNSCFLVKQRNGVSFSSEPNNLTKINSFKFSGLANDRVVGVNANADGGVTLAVKSKKKSKTQKPAKAFTKIVLKKDFRRTAKTIINNTSGNHYRSDLKAAALARYTAIAKSQKLAASGIIKKPKTKRGSRK